MTTTTTIKMMRDDDDRRSASRGGAFVVPGKKILHHHHHRRGFAVNTFLFLILLLIVDVFVESSFAAVIPIPSASWHDFVEACLSESGAEVTGECTTWASGNEYGTMPNWDTSLVEDMSGYDWKCLSRLWHKSTFDGDISKWNTAQVTDMDICFIPLLRSTKTLGVGTQRK